MTNTLGPKAAYLACQLHQKLRTITFYLSENAAIKIEIKYMWTIQTIPIMQKEADYIKY